MSLKRDNGLRSVADMVSNKLVVAILSNNELPDGLGHCGIFVPSNASGDVLLNPKPAQDGVGVRSCSRVFS